MMSEIPQSLQKLPEPATEAGVDPQLVQANKLYQTGFLLIYGKRKSIDKAIKCIQRAITINNSDYKYWQLLGEAYYQRGSLNPAINCLMKSITLAETEGAQHQGDNFKQADCVYSRLRMSDIRLAVGHFDEAAEGYSAIISSDPNNVAALVGLSKTEVELARNSFSAGLVKLGHYHCARALRYSLRSIKLCPNLCLTWKTASDCCLLMFIRGKRDIYSEKIDEDFPGSDGGSMHVDRKTCVELAQRFLCKSLSIEPFQKTGCLWHNLGISLYLKSTLVAKPDERMNILRRSLKCLLRALDLDRNSSQVKNSLGVVLFNLNLYNSAQSFFIKSIRTNLSTSEIQFSNLGYIFLQKGEFRLACVAFNRCQAEEPLYSRSWLGNALVSEQCKQDNLSLLRHLHRIESNYESQLMFATKVSTLPNIEKYRGDVINAFDCMQRLINFDKNSPVANNTLGILMERCQHFTQAAGAFKRAHETSPQDSRLICNRLRLHKTSNSCSLTAPTDDIELIKAAEKLASGGNREYMLNFIYFLFKNSDYKNVNNRMSRLIEKLANNDLKSKIGAQIMLGLTARAEGGDFKSWLFKNIIDLDNLSCVESLVNLLCLMLLGALTNDDQLVDQISRDLPKHLVTYISARAVQFPDLFYSNEGFWLRLSIFGSIFCLKDQSKFIRPLLALFPTLPELWLFMGISLMNQKSKQPAAIYCIKKANSIGSTCADLTMVCDILMSIMVQTGDRKANNLESRVRYLSRAIYKYPCYQILWSLIASDRIHTLKDKKEQSKISSDENSSLFHLAIDHTLKMIVC